MKERLLPNLRRLFRIFRKASPTDQWIELTDQTIGQAGHLGGLEYIPQDVHLQTVPRNLILEKLSQGSKVSDIQEGATLKQLAEEHLRQHPELTAASHALGLDIVAHHTKARERWLRFGLGLGAIGTVALGATAAVVIHRHLKDKQP